VDEATARTLNENVWELERAVASGQASRALRRSLLRAQSQQLAYTEERLGVDPAARASLRIQEDAPDGILLIHGTQGTPADLRPLADALFAAGYTVFSLRLAGHALPGQSADETPWQACAEDLSLRYRMLAAGCARVHVVGLSFGAALALQLDARPKPVSYVLISPAIFPKMRFLQRGLIRFGLDRWAWLRRQLGWEADLTEAMDAARHAESWREVPMLAAMAEDDTRIDPSGLGWLKRRSRARTHLQLRYPRGGHLFHLGDRQTEFHGAVIDFLKRD
jgi:esterase/lipase